MTAETKEITLVSDHEHITSEVSSCPSCRSEDLGWGVLQIEGNIAIQETSCGGCGATWNDVYEFVGYGGFKDADGNVRIQEDPPLLQSAHVPGTVRVTVCDGVTDVEEPLPAGIKMIVREIDTDFIDDADGTLVVKQTKEGHDYFDREFEGPPLRIPKLTGSMGEMIVCPNCNDRSHLPTPDDGLDFDWTCAICQQPLRIAVVWQIATMNATTKE